jgi:predicted metal-dependent hydrolase
MDYRTIFLMGVDHFNSRRFWDAHESWEELWLEAETDVEQFLQGLIQVAAAYHHIQRGTLRGAGRLFDAALRRLDPFPLIYSGIDRASAIEDARADREWVLARLRGEDIARPTESYPRLLVVNEKISPAPPKTPW